MEDKRLTEVKSIIEENQLRFPVAKVSKATGFSKGQVSDTLSGKIPMSDSFYKKFKQSFSNVPNEISTKDEKIAAW